MATPPLRHYWAPPAADAIEFIAAAATLSYAMVYFYAHMRRRARKSFYAMTSVYEDARHAVVRCVTPFRRLLPLRHAISRLPRRHVTLRRRPPLSRQALYLPLTPDYAIYWHIATAPRPLRTLTFDATVLPRPIADHGHLSPLACIDAVIDGDMKHCRHASRRHDTRAPAMTRHYTLPLYYLCH